MGSDLNSYSYQGDLEAQDPDDQVPMSCSRFLESSAAFCCILSFWTVLVYWGRKEIKF